MKRKNKLFILLSSFIAIIMIVLIFFPKGYKKYSYPTEFKEINLDKGLEYRTIMLAGNSSEWDEYIREIGNIIYHLQNEEYLFFYSGHNGEYTQNNVFIGMAYSKDGINWEKYGKMLDLSGEDPYVIYFNNNFYMFFEDKEEVPFRRISLATSKDGRNWEVAKRGVINPSKFIFSWQHQDVSSPVVIQVNNGWVMIYEGRGFFNQGKFGYAYSEDLINWNKKRCPIFSGESYWDYHVVPDDIIKHDNSYIMTYHGYNKKIGEWQSGLAVSNNLKYWKTLTKDPISESDILMIFKEDTLLRILEEHDKEIKQYNIN
ncbi:MAG TPA: hypothetical protein PLH46_02165 [Caldisericia bacterium]|nr:hypothetical protein [Caldisericia bacterium]